MGRLDKAVYETLVASNKAVGLKELFEGVKQRVPDLCDDSIFPCPYCKAKHAKWTHDVQWRLQSLKLKKAVSRVGRGCWKAMAPEIMQPPPPAPTPLLSEHDQFKSIIRECGEVLGRQVHLEYHAAPYVYDVVWKEVEGLPPSHVFEVQDKGSLNGAFSKLQHARDLWKPKLFLIVTGERDRDKVKQLLEPYWQGAFHKLAKHILVLSPEEIEQIHTVFTANRETIRRLTED